MKEETYQFADYVMIQFGDIDEDGDLDLAFTNYYGSIFYLENTGSETEPNFVDKSDNSPFSNIWAGYLGNINFVDMMSSVQIPSLFIRCPVGFTNQVVLPKQSKN